VFLCLLLELVITHEGAREKEPGHGYHSAGHEMTGLLRGLDGRRHEVRLSRRRQGEEARA
jgi:hypothetical protein